MTRAVFFLKVGPPWGHSAPQEVARSPDVEALVDAEEAPLEVAWVTPETEGMKLLERCRGGDRAEWKELYDSHFDFVYRTARRLGTPVSELEDVVQETFEVACRKLATFSSGRFRTWLYRVTANVASGHHRRRRVRQALAVFWGDAHADEVELSPEARVESNEAEAQVAELLSRMTPKKREVFALFELEELSGEEIAERVGCKVETVWTRLHYARKEFERLARKRGWGQLK